MQPDTPVSECQCRFQRDRRIVASQRPGRSRECARIAAQAQQGDGGESAPSALSSMDGNKVAGKCTVEGVAQDVTGEIADQKVTFQHGGEYNGEALTITYSGTFESATSLTGEVNVKPYDVGGTFKAKKKE